MAEKAAVNMEHDFWCDKCGKHVKVEAADRLAAHRVMHADGWDSELGIRLGMTVGVWTCPECLSVAARSGKTAVSSGANLQFEIAGH